MRIAVRPSLIPEIGCYLWQVHCVWVEQVAQTAQYPLHHEDFGDWKFLASTRCQLTSTLGRDLSLNLPSFAIELDVRLI